MKLKDILNEMPSMVPQQAYPYDRESEMTVAAATNDPSAFVEKYSDGNISIRERKTDPARIYLFSGDQAVGVFILVRYPRPSAHLGQTVHQVSNVWIDPDYRNKGFGTMLYNYILQQRKEGFASGAAMTPSSRRVYTSMLNNSSVEVFGLLYNDGEYERVELYKGKDGITTGSAEDDKRTVFVILPR